MEEIIYISFICLVIFFFIYGPIFTKSHMSHRTLTITKILRLGYLDNGCYGNKKSFSQLIHSIYDDGFVERRSGVGP